MACKTNEVAILKGVGVKLDDDNVLVLSYMYHAADKEAKAAGDKSFYRYEGRVVKTADLKAEIAVMEDDAHALEKWRWPTESKTWNPEWFISYDGYDDSKRGAKWLKSRLSKLLDWEAFIKLAKDGIKLTAKGERQSASAKYDLEDYVLPDGTKFSITTPEELLKLNGKWFTKQVILKRELQA